MNGPSGAAERDLHAAIMNLPNESSCYPGKGQDWHDGFAEGHRDARHAAAELAAAASAGRDELVEALESIASRLQMDIDDGGRPDQWSMEDMVRKARAALAKHKGV